jgi:calmodulin
MFKYGEKLSDEDYSILMRETDHDKDGQINFDDFVRMMMAK